MKTLTAILILLLATISLNGQKQRLRKIDSLLIELPKAKKDTNMVNLMAFLCFEYYGINPDEGIKYGERSLLLAEKLNWKKGIAGASSSLASCYKSKSDYPKALEYSFRALKINEELDDKSEIARNLGNIGNVYRAQSDYPKALEYYFKALKIDEELDDKEEIAIKLGNIGVVYKIQSDYSKALEYYFKALKIDEELGRKKGIARHLGNIGSVYRSQSGYSKALEYYFKALKIEEELGSRRGIAIKLGNIGDLYLNLSQDAIYDKLTVRDEFIGLTKESTLSTGIDYTMKAVKISEEIGELSILIFLYNNLYDGYKMQGNYLKALEYYEHLKGTQDSVFNIKKATKFANLEAKRETQIKQKEIEILKKENEIKKVQIYFMITIFILVSMIVLLLYGRFRRKRIMKELMDKKIEKRMLEYSNTLEKTVEEKTNDLQKINKDLEQIVENRTRDLKDTVTELKRFHDATIDREFRMEELRDEIKVLKEKLKNN